MEMMEGCRLPELVFERTGPCWFCECESENNAKNEEDEDPESPDGQAEGPENGETNDASKLGINLKSEPSWPIKHKISEHDPMPEGEETRIVAAAHHLLPGNASVKKANSIHKYMVWKNRNPCKFKRQIGYDINAAENGIWLPGNYAVRKESKFGKNWSSFGDPFKDGYAQAAMKSSGGLQFHDAHPAYSSNVERTLNDVGRKLDAMWVDRSKCPVCGKDRDGQNDPPYGLVGRLNRLSYEHRKVLMFAAMNRKAIESGYYTSSRVRDLPK